MRHSAVTVQVKLSRRVARFNKAVNNPVQRQYAWLLPPWAVIVHRGRRSGRIYRTPVNAFVRRDTLAVVVLYGEQSDWVRNLLVAEGGSVVRGGRTFPLTDVRVVDLDTAAGESVAPVALRIGRTSGKLLLGRLGAPEPGFGRGPKRRG
jgi:deazaflavin-dependent oxidoreductase (nitroreductase family)